MYQVKLEYASCKYQRRTSWILFRFLKSLDGNVWNLKRYGSNDDNNNFNYDDIDKEILQFKYKDLIGESETIVFHDYDNNLDATQQEEGNIKLEWTLKKYWVNKNSIDDTESDDTAQVFWLVIQVISSQLLFWSIYQTVGIMLEMEIWSAGQVVVKDNNCSNAIIHQK